MFVCWSLFRAGPSVLRLESCMIKGKKLSKMCLQALKIEINLSISVHTLYLLLESRGASKRDFRSKSEFCPNRLDPPPRWDKIPTLTKNFFWKLPLYTISYLISNGIFTLPWCIISSPHRQCSWITKINYPPVWEDQGGLSDHEKQQKYLGIYCLFPCFLDRKGMLRGRSFRKIASFVESIRGK